MESTYANERRCENRYEGVFVEYAYVAENDDYRYVTLKPCFLRNFSNGGVSIYVYEPVNENSFVYLRLYDPQSNIPIQILGGIIWNSFAGGGQGPYASQRYNMGIRFMHVNDVDKRRLLRVTNYLELLRPKRKGTIDYA